MNRVARCISCLLLAVLIAASATADPLSDALAAADRHDYATALRLLRPLADKGNAEAQYGLGDIYLYAEGFPHDDAEGAKWYLRAAEQGHAGAQNSLGGLHLIGRGVSEDSVEAAKWKRRAAEQGHAIAQNDLATYYTLGSGVPRDYVQAFMWFELAAARFSPSQKERKQFALENRDYLATSMTPEQIAEARRLASEWKPRPEKQTKK